jgi:GGDEF domain-containing protein
LNEKLHDAGDASWSDTGEFIFVATSAGKDDARRLIERARSAVGEYLMSHDLADKVVMKYGSAIYPDDAKNEDALLKKAKSLDDIRPVC